MTKDVIERYDTLKTKGCPYEIIFGDFNEQLISSYYYNFLTNGDDHGSNIPGTLFDDALPDNKGVEDAVAPNDEYINDEIIIYDDDVFADMPT